LSVHDVSEVVDSLFPNANGHLIRWCPNNDYHPASTSTQERICDEVLRYVCRHHVRLWKESDMSDLVASMLVLGVSAERIEVGREWDVQFREIPDLGRRATPSLSSQAVRRGQPSGGSGTA
jgi:hypothetical protein